MNTNLPNQSHDSASEKVDCSVLTSQQLSAAREAVREITGLAYRLQELIQALDEAGNAGGLLHEIAPILIVRIGCFSAMALEFLNGGDNYRAALHDWLLPTEIANALKGGAQ